MTGHDECVSTESSGPGAAVPEYVVPESVVTLGDDASGWIVDDPTAGEPTPWGLGLLVTVACAAFAACVLVGVDQLLGRIVWWLGPIAAAIVAMGVGWPLWDLRERPVWRWIAWGTYIGLLAGVGSAISLHAIGAV